MTENKKVTVVISEDMPLLERRRLDWLRSKAESELTSDTASLEHSPALTRDVENYAPVPPRKQRPKPETKKRAN